MSWGRFDDKLPRHAKYAPLSDAAFRLAIHANLWAREMGSGGFVPRKMLPDIVRFRGRKLERAIEELIAAGVPLYSVGVWEVDESGEGWWIHDFDAYGAPGSGFPAPAEARVVADGAEPRRRPVDPELSRKRAEAGRRGAFSKHRRAAGGVTEAGVSAGSPANDTDPLATGAANPMANRAASHRKAPGKCQPFATREDPIRDPDPKSNPEDPPKAPVANSGKPLAGGAGKRSGSPPPIRERAQSFLRDRMKTELDWGPAVQWGELEALWQAFQETWQREDRPRHGGDPRVKTILTLYANGRSQEELVRAVRASKRYAPVADNPQYQRLKTILRDDEQVDNLLRLEGAPQRSGKGPQRAKQRGGWEPPRLEVAK